MVGQHCNNPGKPLHHGPDQLVNPLDRLHLFPDVSKVTGLIRRFNMDVDKIQALKCLQCRGSLRLVIRIKVPGCPRYPNHFHPRKPCDPLEQVHCRNDPCLPAKKGPEWDEPGLFPPAPWPYLGRRGFLCRDACPVHRVVCEDLPALLHALPQNPGIFPGGKGGFDQLTHDIVRWTGGCPSPPMHHQNVPVGDAGREGDIREMF